MMKNEPLRKSNCVSVVQEARCIMFFPSLIDTISFVLCPMVFL